jgi:hypothetical protein
MRNKRHSINNVFSFQRPQYEKYTPENTNFTTANEKNENDNENEFRKPFIPPLKSPIFESNTKVTLTESSDFKHHDIPVITFDKEERHITPKKSKSSFFKGKHYNKPSFSTGKKEITEQLNLIKHLPDLICSLAKQELETSVYKKSLMAHTSYTPKHFFNIFTSSRRISSSLKDLKLFLKWTVFSHKGLDDLEIETLFYILDKDRDNIISLADFSYLITDTEGDIDSEKHKLETKRAINYAIENLKKNPESVGEGWDKFKKQVSMKYESIRGVIPEEKSD